MKISRALFDAQRSPRFGTANPERIGAEFWEWMVRGDPERRAGLRAGMLGNGNSAWRARDEFGLEARDGGGPIWCFDRMGATATELADGRVVCVAGEHEDSYDPDFYIYNDVIVLGPDDEVAIYGYPRDLFPPTDFHTATLVRDQIILIGCLGCPQDRRPGTTPVYSLDVTSYRIDPVVTTGEMPSWLNRHEARLDRARGVIAVTGGAVISTRGETRRFVPSVEDYELRLEDGVWCRTTARGWKIYCIRRADNGLFVLDAMPEPPTLFPTSLEYEVVPGGNWKQARVVVAGVFVAYTVELSEIVVTVEGDLPEELSRRVAEDARARAEAQIGCSCQLDGP